MNGGVPNKGLNEQLHDILDQSSSTRDLHNILDQLEQDINLLNNPDNIQYIMSLLEAGTNPNVQNQDGKTLLHYVAERNDIGGIKFLLNVRADPNVRDHSGRTPFKYVTEPNCLQVLKGWGYDLGDSHGNEGNPANNSSNYPNKHNDDQALRDDPGYGSGDDNKTISTKPSDCDRKDEDSSCSSSDYLFLEDSLSMELEIPLTTDEQKLIGKFCKKIRGITAENKQESEESILGSIEKIVNKYLKKGLRLNSSCSNGNEKGDKETVTSLVFKEMEEVIAQRVNPRSSTAMLNTHDYTDESDGDEYKADEYKADEYKADEYETSDIIIKRITSKLLLKGGMGKKFLYGDTELTNKHYGFDYLNDLKKQYDDRKKELKSIACEGIVNKSKQTHEYDFKAEIDNVYFYIKYSQDSIIEPVKIFNKAEALKDKALNLKVGILQIGESIVRVESIDGKRNYKDILKGSIKMSFTTEVGEISIYLSPSKKDGNKIKVEIDEENKAKFNKLKDKSSLGKNCLLEGENVSEVISKNFKMSDSVSTESIETIKGVPFTDFMQACSQQIDTSVKGR